MKIPTCWYVHRPLEDEVRAVGGRYLLTDERRISFGNTEILYHIGAAVVDSSCCGVGGCGFAIVQGVITSWHETTSSDGFAMSRVELITASEHRRVVSDFVQRREKVQQVRFREARSPT